MDADRSERGAHYHDAPRRPAAALQSAATRFWWSDRSLTILLVLLASVIFVIYPLGRLGLVGQVLMGLCFSLMLVSGVLAVAKSRLATILVGALVVANLVAQGISFRRGVVEFSAWEVAAPMLFCAVLALVVLAQVFREGPITMHRIQGAVAVYLLIGLAWSFAYRLIDIAFPDAFAIAGSAGRDPARGDDHKWRFVYFSFVTLTTVGYGDITAVHPVARTLVILEALIGQLFPAILLARLVSMELYHRQWTKQPIRDSGQRTTAVDNDRDVKEADATWRL